MAARCSFSLGKVTYTAIGQFEADGLPVVLYATNNSPEHYCVKYDGSGKYFRMMREALLYMHEKWGQDIIGKPREVWQTGKTRPIGKP